jgi:hypothetical protein
MQPHNHPDYEETFRRIATVLDVIAQEQLEHQRAQALAGQRMDRAEALAGQRMDRVEAALAAYIAHSRERDDETTDKLNGLIELMNRHLSEDHGGTR